MPTHFLNYVKCFLFVFFISICFQAQGLCSAKEQVKEGMAQDLKIIKNVFESKYGPGEWKRLYEGWDIDKNISQASKEIFSSSNPLEKDFQRILKQLFAATKDMNAEIAFYSTEAAFLPFEIQKAEGRYLIAEVSPGETLFNIGDELLEFDGQPIASAIEEFKRKRFGKIKSPASDRLAEIFFTFRMGLFGDEMPPAVSYMTIARFKKKKKIKVIWETISESIASAICKIACTSGKKQGSCLLSNAASVPLYSRKYKISALWKGSGGSLQDKDAFFASQAGLDLGKKIWKSQEKEAFKAAIFQTPQKKRAAYLKFSSFERGERAQESLEESIKLFEKHADVLVIDLRNNPVGSLREIYETLEVFAAHPLSVPKCRLKITQEDVYEALGLLDMLERERLDSRTESMRGYAAFIVQQWHAGKTLTDPAHLNGVASITKNRNAVFTKPILLLVNSENSAASAYFALICKQNKRAKLFGTTTGDPAPLFYQAMAYPNRHGVMFYQLPVAILEQAYSSPLDSFGVAPDIHCELTVKDVKNNYKDYKQSLLSEINRL